MSLPSSCPAAAVILAASQAKTPLAIATAAASDATLLFANDAFAALLDCKPAALVGRRLATLGTAVIPAPKPGVPVRIELAEGIPVALSTAAVDGPDGAPACLLCSLIDARGDATDDAIAREAILLSEVAGAASALMRESSAATEAAGAYAAAATASDIAFDAVAHTQARAGGHT